MPKALGTRAEYLDFLTEAKGKLNPDTGRPFTSSELGAIWRELKGGRATSSRRRTRRVRRAKIPQLYFAPAARPLIPSLFKGPLVGQINPDTGRPYTQAELTGAFRPLPKSRARIAPLFVGPLPGQRIPSLFSGPLPKPAKKRLTGRRAKIYGPPVTGMSSLARFRKTYIH